MPNINNLQKTNTAFATYSQIGNIPKPSATVAIMIKNIGKDGLKINNGYPLAQGEVYINNQNPGCIDTCVYNISFDGTDPDQRYTVSITYLI